MKKWSDIDGLCMMNRNDSRVARPTHSVFTAAPTGGNCGFKWNVSIFYWMDHHPFINTEAVGSIVVWCFFFGLILHFCLFIYLFPRFEMCTQSCHSFVPLAVLCVLGISTLACTLKMNTWTIEPAQHQQVSVVTLSALYQHDGISIELKAQQWCTWSMHGCTLLFEGDT